MFLCFYSGLGRDLLMYICQTKTIFKIWFPMSTLLCYHWATCNWYQHQQSPCTCTQATAGFLPNYFQLREASCFKKLRTQYWLFLDTNKIKNKLPFLANYLITIYTVAWLSFLCQFKECNACKTFCGRLVSVTTAWVLNFQHCIHKICIVRITTQLQ